MITPAQLLSATTPDKIVGYAAGQPLYLIFVSIDCHKRAQELASASMGPVWYLLDLSRAGNVPIMTEAPGWFLQLEEELRLARSGMVTP